MFLTKKNAPAQKKPIKNTRALGGWDDNDDGNNSGVESSAQYSKMSNPNNTAFSNSTTTYSSYSNTKNQEPDLISSLYRNPVDLMATNGNNPVPQTQKKEVQNFYFVDELSEIQCECKAVEDVLIPGGIRLRQNDSVLNEFYNEVKSLDISVIGSLLVCQLYNEDFEVKAKSLYAIEFLVKKNIQFSVYFKLHADKIQDSPSSSENEETYSKIKKGLLTTLGVEIMKPEERRQSEIDLLAKEGITYEDPGYSSKEEPNGLKGFLAIGKKESDKEKDNKEKTVKKFISPSDAKKKTLEGPKRKETVQPKSNEPTDLFELNNAEVKNNKNINLLSEKTEQNSEDLI